MNKKIRVGILFGGKSAEHEISIQSARNVVKALDKEKFEPVLIGIDKAGRWHQATDVSLLLDSPSPRIEDLKESSTELTLMPGDGTRQLLSSSDTVVDSLDVIFPVLHGPMGEDGTVQGFLELADIPYVGPGVLGSAICMDKDVAKRLLREAGISVAESITVTTSSRPDINTARVVDQLGLPLFVKPANMGSSVGVSKVTSAEELEAALADAFLYDRKVLIEAALVGDEVECSVLGNDAPKASVPGRIVPRADFYSYEAKYVDENGAMLEIPAKLPADVLKKVQEVSLRTYKVLECEGMSRVDVFVTKDGEVFVNEVNTIPGFTQISMYPKLWEASGLPYTQLITQLIELAMKRFEARRALRTSIS